MLHHILRKNFRNTAVRCSCHVPNGVCVCFTTSCGKTFGTLQCGVHAMFQTVSAYASPHLAEKLSEHCSAVFMPCSKRCLRMLHHILRKNFRNTAVRCSCHVPNGVCVCFTTSCGKTFGTLQCGVHAMFQTVSAYASPHLAEKLSEHCSAVFMPC